MNPEDSEYRLMDGVDFLFEEARIGLPDDWEHEVHIVLNGEPYYLDQSCSVVGVENTYKKLKRMLTPVDEGLSGAAEMLMMHKDDKESHICIQYNFDTKLVDFDIQQDGKLDGQRHHNYMDVFRKNIFPRLESILKKEE